MEKLSVKEAMEQLDVSETTIRRMIKRGDFPNAYKENRKIVIPQSDIDAYLQQQQQSSDQPEALAESEASGQLEAPFIPPPSQTPEISAPIEADVVDRAMDAAVTEELSEVTPLPELGAESEVEPASEPGEVSPVKTEPAKVSPSVIAQPIEELDESHESIKPEPEPTYTPGAVPASQENEQSFKWVLVQAGILSTTWLEEIFHSMRVALEKYKKKAFPGSSDSQE